MKDMKIFLRGVLATAVFSLACCADAQEQKGANSSKMAAEELRLFTVESGNGGSIGFFAPASRPAAAKKSGKQEQKWRSIAVECGNGGLLTFLVPNLHPNPVNSQVYIKMTKH